MKGLQDTVQRIRNMNPRLRVFLTGTVLLGVAGGIFETTFNNYLNDTFRIGATERGFLELPRELPGFLTALLAGLLFFLAETRIAAVAALATGVGMLGLARVGDHWTVMLAFMTLWSAGIHLMMPVQSSIAMNLAHRDTKGRRLGEVRAAGLAATLIGCLLVWVGMRWAQSTYSFLFTVGGIAAVLAAAAFSRLRMPDAHLERPKFVWHRAYGLYYLLSFLFGARKQIFITFGPWVLIKVFGQPAYIIAQLWICSSVLGILVQPLLGRAIDRIGERRVLILESVGVVVVCIGYGFAHYLPWRGLALLIICACYVGDQLLFGFGMARDTYLSKIAVNPDHVSPTLSMGVSINHIVSMTLPFAGGLLWDSLGHSDVFVVAAAIAGMSLLASMRVRVPAVKPAA